MAVVLRFGHDPVEVGSGPFPPSRCRGRLGGVTETFFPWSLTLIGLAALGAGGVGTVLPAGRRIEVLLALVAGAGAGAGVLGIAGFDGTTPPTFDRLFLVATLVGSLAVATVLARLRRRPPD